MSIPNFDPQTQIYYGVIDIKSINPFVAYEEILDPNNSNYTDLDYKESIDQLTAKFDEILPQDSHKLLYQLSKEIVGDHKELWNKDNLQKIRGILGDFKQIKEQFSEIKDTLIQEFNDHYETSDQTNFLYDDGEYEIINCFEWAFMIIKSPYYTYAPQCSPCVPQAGDLDSIDPEQSYSKKTYCLHPDFFEDENKPKYKIYRVKDGGSRI